MRLRKRKKIPRVADYCVYIVRCKNGMLYTGYTSNLKDRIKLHNSGRDVKFLRVKGPVKLVYLKKYKYFKNALN